MQRDAGVVALQDLVDPPAAVLGPPTLTWDTFMSAPTNATFTLALAAPADDRALGRLFDLLPAVTVAVDTVTDAVVRRLIDAKVALSAAEQADVDVSVRIGVALHAVLDASAPCSAGASRRCPDELRRRRGIVTR